MLWFGSQNLKSPIGGVTLERLITEVKEKVPGVILRRADLNPIAWTFRQAQIASHLVKLSPPWSHLAESALATIPTLIVGGPETVAPTRNESQPAHIVGTELRKLERIHQERNHDIAALDHNSGIGRIGLSVPSVVELPERRHGVVAERPELRHSRRAGRGNENMPDTFINQSQLAGAAAVVCSDLCAPDMGVN
jgi:hypothetical protein